MSSSVARGLVFERAHPSSQRRPAVSRESSNPLQHRNPGQALVWFSPRHWWAHAPAHDLHRLAAARAAQSRARLEPSLQWARGNPEHPLQQRDQAFAVGVQETKVACPPETFGQNMLQEQPQKRSAAEGTQLRASNRLFDTDTLASRIFVSTICAIPGHRGSVRRERLAMSSKTGVDGNQG